MSEPQKGFFNWLLNLLGFGKKDEKTPVAGFVPRIANLIRCHFRGLLTVIICTAIWLIYGNHENRAVYMFLVILVLFILKPLAVPTTSLLPIYFLPMTGLLNSNLTTRFLNSSASLWILSSMIHLLLNSTDVDKYVVVKILSSGSFSPKSMVWKASLASFLMSICSNRLQVSSKMIEVMTPAILNSQGTTETNSKKYKEYKNIINNAIATSSTIGGFVIVHGAISPIMARSLWTAKDVRLDAPSKAALKATIQKHKSGLGKLSLHQKLSILHLILFYITILTRRLHFSTENVLGWQPSPHTHEEYVDDITVAAAFVFALNILPKSYGFVKYLTASTESQLPSNRPESAILFWKFVDKNVIYSYIFLFVSASVQFVALNDEVAFPKLQGLYYDLKDLMIVRILICVIASNIMGDAASSFICCILFSIGQEKQGYEPIVALQEIQTRERYPYLMVCAVACNFCFISPFKNNPSFFCHTLGKVPILKMLLYSVPSLIGCSLILWLGIEVYLKYTFLNEYTVY